MQNQAKNRDVLRYADQRYDIRKQFIRVLQDPDTLANAIRAMHKELTKHDTDLKQAHLRIACNAVLGSAIASLTNAKAVRPKLFKCRAQLKRTSKRVYCQLPKGHEGYHSTRLADGSQFTWPQQVHVLALIMDAIKGGTHRPIDIAKATDLPSRQVSMYLVHLSRQGKVVSPMRGEWWLA